jgi:hypothetical protein
METSKHQKAINRITAAENEIKEAKKLLKSVDCCKKSIFDRVKSVEDACREINLDYDKFLISCKGLTDDEVAYKEIKVIIEALNEEKVEDWLDWNNVAQYKFYPYFKRSGSRFSFHYYYSTLTDSHVGSRFCLKTKELMDYIVKQFLPIYERFNN